MGPFLLERYFAKHEFTAKYLLSCSDCDGYALSRILETATEQERQWWNTLSLGYTESAGEKILREAIVPFYQNISPEELVVASPGELNYTAMQVLLAADHPHVIATFPAYQSLYEPARSLGCPLSFWEPDPRSWTFDTTRLRALIRPNTRLIIINFPHNPTGATLSSTQLQEVVKIARSCGAYLFSDEMYRDLLIASEEKEVPAICDLYEKGISLWGMAKSFGLAGLRIGWLACKDKDFLNKVLSFKDYLSICSSAPSQVLSAICLRHSKDFLGPNVEKIRRNTSLFNRNLDQLPIFGPFIPPRAGSVAFVPLQIRSDSLTFSDTLVQKTGIMAVPAEMFEYPGKYLRIGFGRDNFPEVIERLKEYIHLSYGI